MRQAHGQSVRGREHQRHRSDRILGIPAAFKPHGPGNCPQAGAASLGIVRRVTPPPTCIPLPPVKTPSSWHPSSQRNPPKIASPHSPGITLHADVMTGIGGPDKPHRFRLGQGANVAALANTAALALQSNRRSVNGSRLTFDPMRTLCRRATPMLQRT